MSAEEQVDVVDERDRVLTQATRQDVRRRNLRHRGVYILVFNGAGQLFVHQRSMTKDLYPGCWDTTVSGVLTAGEDYDQGARRELREELGVTATILRRLFALRHEDETNRVIGMVYSCTAEGPFTLQPSEIVAGKWMDLDEAVERTQWDPFCLDGLEAFRLYLSKLAAVRPAP